MNYYKEIAQYFNILKRLRELTQRQFQQFKNKTLKYLVQGQELFHHRSKNILIRYIVNNLDQIFTIINFTYNYCGYKGVKVIYWQIVETYWWESL